MGGGKGAGSALQLAMQKKLHGAQFRTLNETLYTQSGDANFAQFQKEPTLADARGFAAR